LLYKENWEEPLKYLKTNNWVFKRGLSPSFKFSSPFPLLRERGTQGDGVAGKNWRMRLK
jgi:hypothetical protein